MKQLTDKIFNDCRINYKLTMRKFKMIKSTPKDNHYLFLPLTKKETVEAWQEGIRRYVNNSEALPKVE